MKKTNGRLSHMTQHLRHLDGDEGGAEGLEKLLIVAAVILPLLGLLIFFRDELADWVRNSWQNIKSQGDQQL